MSVEVNAGKEPPARYRRLATFSELAPGQTRRAASPPGGRLLVHDQGYSLIVRGGAGGTRYGDGVGSGGRASGGGGAATTASTSGLQANQAGDQSQQHAREPASTFDTTAHRQT